MTYKRNEEIRSRIRASGFFFWEIAQQIGIHEKTLYGWLRDDPMPAERKAKIENALNELIEKEK